MWRFIGFFGGVLGVGVGVWMGMDGVVGVLWEVVVLVGYGRIKEGKNMKEVNHDLHVCLVSLCSAQCSQRYPC